jgi:hypothetical protein
MEPLAAIVAEVRKYSVSLDAVTAQTSYCAMRSPPFQD